MIQSLTSPAFAEDGPIPIRHTEDGDDLSPAIAWFGLPEGTEELALIVDDPDAPTDEPWVHWVLYKIPASLDGLPEGLPQSSRLDDPAGMLQGKTTWGTVGYRGPAPPKGHGTHHYHFKLYALDAPIEVEPEPDKKALMLAMSGHVLSHRELVGTYERSGETSDQVG